MTLKVQSAIPNFDKSQCNLTLNNSNRETHLTNSNCSDKNLPRQSSLILHEAQETQKRVNTHEYLYKLHKMSSTHNLVYYDKHSPGNMPFNILTIESNLNSKVSKHKSKQQ